MILVTLGTHQQPMRRLVPQLARIAREMPQLGPFRAQMGTTPAPEGWTCEAVISPARLRALIAAADIVITHGGPATIAEARAAGRLPIVVPRRAAASEHVDDHQSRYATRLASAGEVLLVQDERSLAAAVADYHELVAALPPPLPHDPASAIREFGAIAGRLLPGRG